MAGSGGRGARRALRCEVAALPVARAAAGPAPARESRIRRRGAATAAQPERVGGPAQLLSRGGSSPPSAQTLHTADGGGLSRPAKPPSAARAAFTGRPSGRGRLGADGGRDGTKTALCHRGAASRGRRDCSRRSRCRQGLKLEDLGLDPSPSESGEPCSDEIDETRVEPKGCRRQALERLVEIDQTTNGSLR